MTRAELTEIERDAVTMDPATVPHAARARVELHNERVLLLARLLRRARMALDAGARIEPEVAHTIRLGAAALRASRVRVLDSSKSQP